jgi:hypothetical protein
VGFVVDKVALGNIFSDYFGFPCQFSFHRLFHIHLSSGAGTIDQIVADVPSGHKKLKRNWVRQSQQSERNMITKAGQEELQQKRKQKLTQNKLCVC